MERIFICFILSIAIFTLGAGYTGTLPDIEADFAYMKKNKSEKTAEPFGAQRAEKLQEKELKPAPRENDSYIDIIVKRDKTSKYINDLNSIIDILLKMRRCLNTSRDIQMFNAAASNLIDHIEYIRTEYQDKPEAGYDSYRALLILSKEIRETASFWTQGLAVMQYQPYTSPDNIYTKENLDNKLDTLLEDINQTVFILKKEK